MTRPTFGRPLAPAIAAPALAIVAQCRDPRTTTARRLQGEPTPCYRCLAFTFACHFEMRRLRP